MDLQNIKFKKLLFYILYFFYIFKKVLTFVSTLIYNKRNSFHHFAFSKINENIFTSKEGHLLVASLNSIDLVMTV